METENPSVPGSPEPGSNIRTQVHFKKIPGWLFIFIPAVLLIVLFVLYSKNQSAPNYTPISSNVTNQPSSQNTQTASPAAQLTFTKSPLSLAVTIQSTDSGKIKGTLKVTNKTTMTLSDLFYDMVLNAPDNVKQDKTSTGKTIKVGTFSNVLMSASEQLLPNLNAGESKTVNFEIPYSPHLHPGQYRITSQVSYKPMNTLVNTADTLVNLTGDGQFLNVDKCADVLGTTDFALFSAPVSTPGKEVVGKCQMENPTNQTLTLKTKTDFAVMHVFGYPDSQKSSQTSDQTITFKPGETKILTFNLPQETNPQVYESLVTLVDSSNNPVSPPQLFRWTIPGASANITDVLADRDYYSSGDTASIKVVDTPSMDLYWSTPSSPSGTVLKNAKVVVAISSNGQSCGQGEQNLPVPTDIYSWKDQTIPVKITQDCKNPAVSAQIFDGTTKLAEFGKPYITSANTLSNLPKISTSNQSASFYILAAVLIILLSFLSYFMYKKKGPIIPLLILFIGLSSLLTVKPNIQVRADYFNPSNQELDCTSGTTGWTNFTGSASESTNNTAVSASASETGPGHNYWCANDHPYTAIGVDFSNGGGHYDLVPFPPSSGPGDIFGPNTAACEGSCSYNYGLGSYQANGNNNSYSWANSGGSVSIGQNVAAVDVSYNFNVLTIHGLCDANGNNIGNNAPYLCYLGAGPGCGAPGGAYHYDVPSCTYPDPSQTCSYQTYTDIAGHTCQGTKQCDTTPPVTGVPIIPPGQTCISNQNNGQTADNLQSNYISVTARDNVGFPASGVKSVALFVKDITTGNPAGTVNASKVSGDPVTGGTWSGSILQIEPSMVSGDLYQVTAQATDVATNISTISGPSATFVFDTNTPACVGPFLKAPSGDVHSNQGISAPGGPQ